MLTWEQCEQNATLLPDEFAVFNGNMPSPDDIQVVLDAYAIESHLNRNPGIRDTILDDIETARSRQFFELSGLLKLAIQKRLDDRNKPMPDVKSE